VYTGVDQESECNHEKSDVENLDNVENDAMLGFENGYRVRHSSVW
jgi:hypothetical protein